VATFAPLWAFVATFRAFVAPTFVALGTFVAATFAFVVPAFAFVAAFIATFAVAVFAVVAFFVLAPTGATTAESAAKATTGERDRAPRAEG
jgi:hypothetical protein